MTTTEKDRYEIWTMKDDWQQIQEIDIKDGKIERKTEIKTDAENKEQDWHRLQT